MHAGLLVEDWRSQAIEPPKHLLDRLGDVAFICSSDGRQLEYLNEAAEAFLGTTQTEFSTREPWWLAVITEASRNDFKLLLTSEPRTASEPTKLSFHTPSGLIHTANFHTVCHYSDHILLIGQPSWAPTEVAERLLSENRFLLHTLLDNIPDSIYFKDRESRFVRMSQSMAKKFSFSDRNYVIGKSDADIFTSEHAKKALADEQEIMRTGQPMVANVERETWPDRPDTWCSTTKMPLFDESGKVIGTFGISRDVTELMRIDEALREATLAAEHANRAKSDFLANMSHEIRTPMNGIIGMSELLADTRLDIQQASFVEMIQQSASSLLRLLNDILDFSKIEAGKLELESTTVEIRECVGGAVKSLANRAAQKGLELILRIDPAIPDYLMTDPGRLRQILINLVGNAIKFTEAGEIVVNVKYACGPPTEPLVTLLFSVRDTGIGIGLEQQAHIFGAFCQADATTTRKYGGTGLGLSISSQLVAMMGGQLWVESEPTVRQGSEFYFNAKFPIAATPEGLRPIDRTNLHGLSVLVVDDNSTNRAILDETLRRFGMLVTLAESGQRALQLFDRASENRANFQLLIIDRMMPEMDGLEFMERLGEQSYAPLPPAIMYSSSGVGRDEPRARALGIVAYLQKPALQAELLSAIELALGMASVPPSTEAASRYPQPSRRLRILLAEDGAVNRAVAVGLFERAGHELTIVENGIEAIEAWKSQAFDAIFMDVQMPILDGVEATRAIRLLEVETGQHIPIIAMTAAAMKGDRERFLEAQMDDYLSKPIDFDLFDAILQRLTVYAFQKEQGYQADTSPPENRSPTIEKAASNSTSGKSSKKTLSTTGLVDFLAPFSRLKCTAEQQRALVETLGQETRQRLDEIVRGLEQNDLRLVIRAAHSLKSAAGLFGAKRLVTTASQLEQSSRDGDLKSVSKLFPELRADANDVQIEIDQWLSQ